MLGRGLRERPSSPEAGGLLTTDEPVSVVVPGHEAEGEIGACLDALLPQLRASDEVIVVDDGSLDGTSAVAEARGAAVLRQPRRGAYVARNAGIAAARNDVVVFTDADCVPQPGWLTALTAALSDPVALVALGRRTVPGGSLALSLLMEYENAKDEYVLTGGRPELYYGFTCNMAVRRRALREAGGFAPVPRGADTIFVREVVDRHGHDAVVFVPDAIVVHREMRGVTSYLRKAFLYGRHRRLTGGAAGARALRPRDRLRVAGAVVRRRRYGTLRTAALGTLLGAGMLAWWAGRVTARIHRAL